MSVAPLAILLPIVLFITVAIPTNTIHAFHLFDQQRGLSGSLCANDIMFCLANMLADGETELGESLDSRAICSSTSFLFISRLVEAEDSTLRSEDIMTGPAARRR